MDERERFREVERLFRDASALPADEREAFVTAACGGDERLCREVLALLARGEKTDARLEPVADIPGMTERASHVPERVGRFRVLGVLGEGGMGVVYEAEQDSPRRTVALKLIRPGLASRGTLARFRLEGEVLGRLQHPGIATVYESGTEDTGAGEQPYFAMELIRGRPLTEHADAENLGVRERLGLIVQVCEAVHHAHQRGIIHRDLKPGNILVTGDGRPKVLDFGVARAVDQDLRTTTLRTERGQLVGTVPYMSPEQVGGDPEAVDTRSDVYSLGVVAFELLSGRLPHDVRGAAAFEMIRTIGEEDPARLSTVDRSFRGDIDTIIAKALEREKDRRYQSASELAGDIRRYLSDEPIQARPPTTWYQLAKFARRNKAFVASAGSVAAIVLVALIVLGVLLVRTVRAEKAAGVAADEARVQRDAATDEAAKATQLNQLFIDMIAGIKPEVALGADTTLLRTILQTTSERVDSELTEQPVVRATLHHKLGSALLALAEYKPAADELRSAIDLYAKNAPDNIDRWRAENSLAEAVYFLGDLDEAESLHHETIEELTRRVGSDDDATLDARNTYGSFLHALTRFDEAKAIWEDVYKRYVAKHGEEDERSVVVLRNVAIVSVDLGDYAGAEPLARRALELSRGALGQDAIETLRSERTLAVVLNETNRSDEALPLIRHVCERYDDVFGPEHERTLRAHSQLAAALEGTGSLDEAETEYRSLAETYARVYGEDSANALIAANNLAVMLMSQGRLNEAEPFMLRVLEGRRRTLPPGHLAIVNSLNALGGLYRHKEQFDKALPYYEEAYKIVSETLPEGHFIRGIIGGGLGDTLTGLGRYDEAEAKLLESDRVLEAAVPPGHPYRVTSVHNLVTLYEKWGKANKASEWRAKLPEDDPVRTGDD